MKRLKNKISSMLAFLLVITVLFPVGQISPTAEAEAGISAVPILVHNIDELNMAMDAAASGDTIVLANGIWKDVQLSFHANATAEQPVTLRAETPGKVRITGDSRLSLDSNHLIVDGLYFTNGSPVSGGAVITFNADYGRVTNTAIVNFNPPSAKTGYYWVMFKGSHNRLDHGLLQGKNNDSPVVGNDFNGAQYNTVDTMHIKDIPYIADSNGREIFRIWGYGRNDELGDEGTFFTLENNLFEHADGEGAEVVSLKSNKNIVRNNTILESMGALVGRSGHTNTFKGNLIIGNNVPGTKGLRVTGKNLTITNNYVETVEKDVMIIYTGEHLFDKDHKVEYLWDGFKPIVRPEAPYGYVVNYGQVRDSLIEGNVFYNNGGVDIDLGKVTYKRNAPKQQLVLIPENNRLINNISFKPLGGTAIDTPVQDKAGNLGKFTFQPNLFEGNVVYGANAVIHEPSSSEGILVKDVREADVAAIQAKRPKALTAQDVGPAWVRQGNVGNVEAVAGQGEVALTWTEPSSNKTPKKVAFVGDSITFGYKVPESYPIKLGKLLGPLYEVRNFGISGATMVSIGGASYWIKPEYAASKAWNPDIVVIMLGTNDSKPGNWKNKDQFIVDYKKMINEYKQLPSHPEVYVNLPPKVYGSGNFGITDEVVSKEIIPIIRDIAQQENVKVNDVYTATSGMPQNFTDMVHPNDAGTKAIANAVLDGISPILEDYSGVAIYQNSDATPKLIVPKGTRKATIAGLANGLSYTFTLRSILGDTESVGTKIVVKPTDEPAGGYGTNLASKDNCSSCTYFSSTDYSIPVGTTDPTAKYGANAAFDGNPTATRWSAASAQATNQFLGVSFGAETTYNLAVITEYGKNSIYRVSSYWLESSNDGITYEMIPGTKGTTIGSVFNGGTKAIPFSSPVKSKFMRLKIEESRKDSSKLPDAAGNTLTEPSIWEIEVYNVPPVDVLNPSATSSLGGGAIDIAWMMPENADFEAINIYIGYTKIKTVSQDTESVKINGLENGKDYVFTIKTESAEKGESRGVSTAAVYPDDGVVPDAPKNLQAAAGNGAINLTWAAPSYKDIAKYVLAYYDETSPGATTVSQVVYAPAASYSLEKLTPGHTYHFTLQAVSASRRSSVTSNEAAAVFKGTSYGFSGTAGDGYAQLMWSPYPKPVAGYNLYMNDAWISPSVTSEVYTVTGSTYQYTAGGLTNELTYSFYMRAVQTDGTESQPSEVILLTPSVMNGIAISGIPSEMTIGDSKKATVTALYNGNMPVDVTAFSTLQSSNEGVAAIDKASGLFKALIAGQTVLSATYGGKTDRMTVNVSEAGPKDPPPATVKALTLSGLNATMTVNQSAAITLTANYSDGTSKAVTADLTAKYTSSSPNVADIIVTGAGTAEGTAKVTAKTPGVTTITATYGGMTTTAAAVQVFSAGGGGGYYPSAPSSNLGDKDFKVTKNSTDGSANVTVDADKLKGAFKALTEKNQQITITYDGTETNVRFTLPVSALTEGKQASPNATIVIKTKDLTYELPLNALDLSSLAKDLGVKPEEMTLTISMVKASGKEAEAIAAAAKKNGVKLLSDGYNFTITVEAKGKSMEVTDFHGKYIARTMQIPGTVNTSTTTVVVINPATGDMFFVPATFAKSGDKTVTTMMRQGNSLYAAVDATRTFADLKNHPAKADIELLAAKLLMDGVGNSNFAPDNSIKRSEFASLLVRALGLSEFSGIDENNPQAGPTKFTDVSTATLFSGSILLASQYGLINGYEDGSFKPDASITNEEMAVMLSRALKIAGKSGDASKTVNFEDRQQISEWARAAVNETYNTGIVQKPNSVNFEPKVNATRGQTAVALKKFLQFVGFIN